ncbi:uncharacterized protein LAESUDRAFT_186300 [Laetiporus sulphureus 93-53]|uniref:Uncharacterized protein n=1 Tax=Laetiporus sulphureus 93-53 TaxID=1314785 RepID=A0A165E531_9APHY|nr:uncharacterized protein LAESUDRAFT_186300 [Laetiporus sulphureus 93-53]KZT06252.1 hypothetical protein LAESUDRAFT_186300 [Laetiporus sulphureus 93-53]
MQRQRDYTCISRCDSQIWRDWLQSEQAVNSSWSLSSATLSDDPHATPELKDVVNRPSPITYSLTPPSPGSPLSAECSLSQSSIETESDYDELPEIPFISSSSLRYQTPSGRPSVHDRRGNEDTNSERSFWAALVHASASHLTDGSETVVGAMGEGLYRFRRQRAASISSDMSSRTRPAPAKSILSSSSSIRTRTGRSPPSVKFLDMPTIHYEEDEDEYEYHSPVLATPEKRKRRLLKIRWFLRLKKKPQATQARPTISGPFPLWERPSCTVYGSAADLRSKSCSSFRSVRTCGSRLQTYWSRVARREL